MGERIKIHAANGDIIEVELVVPANYKYEDENRNDFIDGFGTGTISDSQIESAIRRGWAKKVGKVGEWR